MNDPKVSLDFTTGKITVSGTDAAVRAAAVEFMRQGGIDNPSPDAVDQLTLVFLKCLRIMCDSDHPWDPHGKTWRKSGRLGALTDARKKFERLWERLWIHGQHHDDSLFDCINFLGFTHRSEHNRFNEWGDPGFPEDA